MTGLTPDFPPFRPGVPWWGPDLQTLRNFLSARAGGRPVLDGERLHLAMNDGSGDRLAALLTPAPGGKPLVVLIHGLTGCETSMNMVRAAMHHHARGHPVLRLNLRGAGPSRASCAGDYHAGCSKDLAAPARRAPAARATITPAAARIWRRRSRRLPRWRRNW